MDEQQLQEIEARADLATKGVWLHTFDQDNHELGNVWGPDGDAIAERVHGNLALGGDGIDNAAFIAHAREDVPALIAEVRRLQKEATAYAANLRGKHEVAGATYATLLQQRDAALAERDALFNSAWALLNDEPQANGEYVHAVTCSADRKKPIGCGGCSCQLGRRIKLLASALTEARRVLRLCEWRGWATPSIQPIGGFSCCPVCASDPREAHATDCALAAVLAQEEK